MPFVLIVTVVVFVVLALLAVAGFLIDGGAEP